MPNAISLRGQWVGSFTYGPGYGKDIYGEKVLFRFFLEDLPDGQFKGTSVDIEGFGANMDTAIIMGFVDGSFISFTKEYPNQFYFDGNGEAVEDQSSKHRLSYTGEYNANSGYFKGDWELWTNERPMGDGSLVDIDTGTWEMTRDNSI